MRVACSVYPFPDKRQRDARQTVATVKRRTFYPRPACNNYGTQRVRYIVPLILVCRRTEDITEMRVACSVYPLPDKRQRDALQTDATVERIIADACHACRDFDARQSAASIERIIADACHACRDLDARQAAASIERLCIDPCYGICNASICNAYRNYNFPA